MQLKNPFFINKLANAPPPAPAACPPAAAAPPPATLPHGLGNASVLTPCGRGVAEKSADKLVIKVFVGKFHKF